MKRIFVFQEGNSQKFWSIEIKGASLDIAYGRLGTAGQVSSKLFDSDEKCKKEADKLIKEKTGKGYKELSDDTAMPTVDTKMVQAAKEKQSADAEKFKEQFWTIIDNAKESARGWEGMCDPLQEALMQLDAKDILRWGQVFNFYHELSYKNKLWAAAYIINGGCSDDGFDYFRAWLIAQGKEVFLKALLSPESLAELNVSEGDVEFEDIMSIASTAFEEIDAERDYYEMLDKCSLTMEEKRVIKSEIIYDSNIDVEWDEDEDMLSKLLPKLSKKFE
ncbi:MAG: DUF4240 domain-containing protein [Methanomassiliicoccaceae archaeon]|jgi:predicted DNA-binding WGR domain protein|nr:DUF4240 domain-containing protein [Methanomassiliicoccaceae archaeon]